MSIKLTSKSGGLAGSLSINATEVLTITEDGKLGVNVNTLDSNEFFKVSDPSTGQLVFGDEFDYGAPVLEIRSNNVGGGDAHLVLASNTGTGEGFISAREGDGTFTIGSYGAPITFDFFGNGEKMRIDSNGNVGIGTTQPLGELGVSNSSSNIGESSADISSYITSTGYRNFEYLIHNQNPDGYGGAVALRYSRGTKTIPSTVLDNDGIGGYYFQAYDGSAYRTAGLINCMVNGTPSGGIVSADMSFHTSGSERMRINANGSVGIGTTTPKGRLHIAGGESTYATTPGALFLDSGRTDNGAGYGIIQGERAVKSNKPQFIMSHYDAGSFLELYMGGGNWAAGAETNIFYFCTTPDYGTTTSTIAHIRLSIDQTGNFARCIPGATNSTRYPDFCARAWVNFNGTGTVAIRGSGNVSSITDNNTGDYTVNFTTAMPDANYSFAGAASDNNETGDSYLGMSSLTSTYITNSSIRIFAKSGSTSLDSTVVTLAVFR